MENMKTRYSEKQDEFTEDLCRAYERTKRGVSAEPVWGSSKTLNIILKVRKLRTGDIYAVKVLNRQYFGKRGNEQLLLQNFHNEIDFLKRSACCREIVDLYGSGVMRCKKKYYEYYEMEYLTKIEDVYHGQMSPVEVMELGIDVCSGLTYIHRNLNAVHRDIKPANIMVRLSAERVEHVIIDFGTVCRMDAADVDGKMNGVKGHTVFSDQYAGTPEFTDPLVAANVISQKSDIYSLAATMNSLLGNSNPERVVWSDHGPEVNVISSTNPKKFHITLPDAPEEFSQLLEKTLSIVDPRLYELDSASGRRKYREDTYAVREWSDYNNIFLGFDFCTTHFSKRLEKCYEEVRSKEFFEGFFRRSGEVNICEKTEVQPRRKRSRLQSILSILLFVIETGGLTVLNLLAGNMLVEIYPLLATGNYLDKTEILYDGIRTMPLYAVLILVFVTKILVLDRLIEGNKEDSTLLLKGLCLSTISITCGRVFTLLLSAYTKGVQPKIELCVFDIVQGISTPIAIGIVLVGIISTCILLLPASRETD